MRGLPDPMTADGHAEGDVYQSDVTVLDAAQSAMAY